MKPAVRDLSHLGGCLIDQPDNNIFMPDVWEYLILKYGIKSVLDVGCGAGWSAEWFHNRGMKTVGIEGFQEAIDKNRLPRHLLIQWDYTDGPLVAPCQFDLAWCAEVVEHIAAEFVPNFLATFRACRYVCLTFAVPGQGGYHHVNEQLEAYWEGKLSEAGFLLNRKETDNLRKTWDNQAWGRQTLTFFENQRWTE